MASDRKLAGNFYLHEFTGWERATEEQVARLQETVQRVLQPIRSEFGTVVPTSWIRWSSGAPRTGAHAQGGTVDFVTPYADLRDVFEWGRVYLLPSGYIGRWIYEPYRGEEEGGVPQGEHIHVAPRADMLAYAGDGTIQALEETSEGRYVLRSEYFDGTGTELDPFQLPGIQVAGTRAGWLAALLFLGLIFNLAGQAAPRAS